MVWNSYSLLEWKHNIFVVLFWGRRKGKEIYGDSDPSTTRGSESRGPCLGVIFFYEFFPYFFSNQVFFSSWIFFISSWSCHALAFSKGAGAHFIRAVHGPSPVHDPTYRICQLAHAISPWPYSIRLLFIYLYTHLVKLRKKKRFTLPLITWKL